MFQKILTVAAFLIAAKLWANLEQLNQVGWLLLFLLIPTVFTVVLCTLRYLKKGDREFESMLGLAGFLGFWMIIMLYSFDFISPEKLFGGNMNATSNFILAHIYCSILSIMQSVPPLKLMKRSLRRRM